MAHAGASLSSNVLSFASPLCFSSGSIVQPLALTQGGRQHVVGDCLSPANVNQRHLVLSPLVVLLLLTAFDIWKTQKCEMSNKAPLKS